MKPDKTTDTPAVKPIKKGKIWETVQAARKVKIDQLSPWKKNPKNKKPPTFIDTPTTNQEE